MSNSQLVENLSRIIEAQAEIINEQHAALRQLGAACMEEKIRAVKLRYAETLGADEWPEN